MGILELGLGLLGESLIGIMIGDLVGTECWMETIPGSQCYERFPLDASILEDFGRLLIPSFIFLLSSSNLSSIGYVDVVGDGFERVDGLWVNLGFG